MGYLLEKALRVVGTVKPEREESLSDAIAASCSQVIAEVIELGRWKPSAATRRIEDHLVNIQNDVLGGKARLIDFKKACQEWKHEGTKTNI